MLSPSQDPILVKSTLRWAHGLLFWLERAQRDILPTPLTLLRTEMSVWPQEQGKPEHSAAVAWVLHCNPGCTAHPVSHEAQEVPPPPGFSGA